MTVDHRVGTCHSCGGLTDLTLLSEDTETVAGKFLKEPSVNNIETVVSVTLCPAVPADTSDTILRSLELYDLSVDGETEGLEEEGSVRIEFCLACLLIVSIGRVGVILLPYGCMSEIRLYVSSAKTFNDNLIACEVVCGAGKILLRPIDFVQHNCFPFFMIKICSLYILYF